MVRHGQAGARWRRNFFLSLREVRFHVSAALCAVFGRRECAGPRGINSCVGRDQLGRLVLQRPVGGASRRRRALSGERMVIPHSKSAGDRLYLVELSSRSAEPSFACPDAWRFRRATRKSGDFSRCLDCGCRRDQSISSNRCYLSGLPALLESSGQPRRGAHLFTLRLARAIARF